MTPQERSLDLAIDRVVRNGNCSGCGMCTILDAGLEMQLDAAGFNRPVRTGESRARADAVEQFTRGCPGERVSAQAPAGSRRHPTMGPVIQVWQAWATDPEVRFAGSSGGTLTALAAWLTATGEASSIVGAGSSKPDPRRTVSVRITTRDEAIAAAGSRYAPASNCAVAELDDPSAGFTGKPCEVSALRAIRDDQPSDPSPILMSFFCAGTPSQHATDSLVALLGVDDEERVAELWYRGRGWPGRFSVVTDDGRTLDTSYDESWGKHLGPTVQWRCKICPDGVGESADVTAADLWEADERGYPDFSEGEGISALIARTQRGYDLVQRAIAAGILTASPIEINHLAAVQPLQRQRRLTLLGRLVGTVLAGGRVPRFHGFGLVALALPRLREVLRVARGTYRRRRAFGQR